MAYLQQLGRLASGLIGTPPSVTPPNIGAAPTVAPAQPHIEPPPYDVAMDPAWKGILDPNDHELRNILNGMSPEERQVFLVRLGKAGGPPAVAAAATGKPLITPGL